MGRVSSDCLVAFQTPRIAGKKRTVNGLFWDQTIGHNHVRKLGLWWKLDTCSFSKH